jgi:hypothetical protein
VIAGGKAAGSSYNFFSQADGFMGGCNVILRLSAPKLVY